MGFGSLGLTFVNSVYHYPITSELEATPSDVSDRDSEIRVRGKCLDYSTRLVSELKLKTHFCSKIVSQSDPFPSHENQDLRRVKFQKYITSVLIQPGARNWTFAYVNEWWFKVALLLIVVTELVLSQTVLGA